MRIMFLLFSFTVGGTEKLVSNICNEMCSREQNVHLYIVNNLVDNILLSQLDDRVTVFLQGRKANGGDIFNSLFKIMEYIKKNDIEVVHSNSFDAPELLILSKIVKPRLRIIHTVHGMHQYEKLSLLRKVYRNILCDRLIGVSDCVVRNMVFSGASSHKTIMIYNGIEGEFWTDIKGKKKLKSDEFKIGCIARIDPKVKGQDILLEAIRLLLEKDINVTCLLAGEVSTLQKEDYNNLLKYIEEYNLTSHIEFLGNVTDVPRFLKTIDICVVPSRSEGFGLALVEAMSMGVPVIASDIDGPKEIIDKFGVGMKFVPGNAHSLAQAIEETIIDYQDKKSDAIQHMMQIQETFSMDRMCRNLLEVYRH